MVVRSRFLLTCLAAAAVTGGAIMLGRSIAIPAIGTPAEAPSLRDTAPLSIALAGDALLVRRLPQEGEDAAFDALSAVVRSATLGIANLEQNLLESAPAEEPSRLVGARWPFGGAAVADDLVRAGFTVLSCANNHAVDHGVEGLRQTLRVFARTGLAHAGCGENLGAARRAVILGERPRRVAVLAVASSVAAPARAAPAKADIQGRPGVSALRYVADITVDAKTFATLRESLIEMQIDVGDRADVVLLSGTPIKKGARTIVQVLPNEDDMADIAGEVRRVRPDADAVIVSLHAHEPSNFSDVPADFVRTFAHRTIDAGADVVFAHGPHQLRGVEAYGRGAIVYSLGNFAFDHGAVPPEARDVYEAGVDLYDVLLGGAIGNERPPIEPAALENPIWWEGVIAVAAFGASGLESMHLHPIDLGVDRPLDERGLPRLAEPPQARAILERLAALSEKMNTSVDLQNSTAKVTIKD